MSVYMGQWMLPPTSTTATFYLPPGPYNVNVYDLNAATVFIGVGTSLTIAPNLNPNNGLAVITRPTNFEGQTAAKGGQIWVANTAATTVAVNYVVSTINLLECGSARQVCLWASLGRDQSKRPFNRAEPYPTATRSKAGGNGSRPQSRYIYPKGRVMDALGRRSGKYTGTTPAV